MFDLTSLVVEQCGDTDLYVGYTPNVPGAHAQGETLDELYCNLQEVIAMPAEGDQPEPVDELLKDR